MRTSRPRASLLSTLLLSLFLVSCFGGKGGGGGGGGGNGGGANNPAPSISVSVAASPVSPLVPGQQTTVTATVTNDGSNKGVIWTISQKSAGTLSCQPPLAQLTCTGVIYTATRTVPSAIKDTITATSVADPTKSASIDITTNPTVSLLFSRFAFYFSGFDANGAVSIVGSINVDANGNVTGEEDFKDPTTPAPAAQAILGFCQNIPATLTGFCKLTAGGKTSQYDFALRNNFNAARFFEDPTDNQKISGSGIMILQEVPAAGALTTVGGFNGAFSFGFVGTDAAAKRLGVAGTIFTDLGTNITSGQGDVNDFGTLIQPAAGSNVTGNMIGPVDSSGRVTAQITIGTAPAQRILKLALYILAPVSSASNNAGRAFAIDITPSAINAQVLTGQLFFQANPPPVFANTSFNVGVNVFDLWGVTAGGAATTAVGTLTPSAAAPNVRMDVNSGGVINGGAPAGTPETGSISGLNVAANGRTLFTTTVNAVASNYVAYLDAANDGFLLGTDNTVSFGFIELQAPTAKFTNANIFGNYVVGSFLPGTATVPDGAAVITLTPTVANSGTFTVGGAASGTYSFDPNTGRGIATATAGNIFGNSTAAFYIIAPGKIVIMGTQSGLNNDTMGYLQF